MERNILRVLVRYFIWIYMTLLGIVAITNTIAYITENHWEEKDVAAAEKSKPPPYRRDVDEVRGPYRYMYLHNGTAYSYLFKASQQRRLKFTSNVLTSNKYRRNLTGQYQTGQWRLVRGNSWLCQPGEDGSGHSSHVVAVLSALDNRERRNAIRETWGRDCNNDLGTVALYFVVGTSHHKEKNSRVLKEFTMYRDILQVDIVDSYRNITSKSLAALQWVSTNCGSSKYIFKTDDDSFINIKLLLNITNSLMSNVRILGAVHASSQVQRSGQWKVTPAEYRPKLYPPYCAGAAYVIATSVTTKLLHASRSLYKIPVEDAFITGILAEEVGIPRTHHPAFPNWAVFPYRQNICAVQQGKFLGVHGVGYENMYSIWEDLKRRKACELRSTLT